MIDYTIFAVSCAVYATLNLDMRFEMIDDTTFEMVDNKTFVVSCVISTVIDSLSLMIAVLMVLIFLFERILRIPPAPPPVNNHLKPIKNANIPPAPRPVQNANVGLDLTPVAVQNAVAQSPRMDLTPATIQSPEVIFAVNYENKGREITQKKDDDNASEDNEQEVIFAVNYEEKKGEITQKKDDNASEGNEQRKWLPQESDLGDDWEIIDEAEINRAF